MKPTLLHLGAALCATAAFTQCTSVTSRQVVGAAPAKLDPAKWDGAWTDDAESVVFFRVKDAENGLLEVGSVERTDTELKFTKFDVQLRASGDWLWANFKGDEDPNYTFARVSEPERHLLFWAPDPASFVRRVKSGAVKGELLKDAEGKETGSVIIDGLDAEHIRAIQTGEWSDVFDWIRPGILRRLGAPKPAQ